MVTGAIAATVLAFGPSTLSNRKLMPLNSWAYEFGTNIPAIFPVPPHPNGAAAVLVVAIALLGGVMLFDQGKWRYCLLIAAAPLTGALLLTASRSGWLALVSALLPLAFLKLRRNSLPVLTLAGLSLALFVLWSGPPGPEGPALVSTRSMSMRIEQWEQSLLLLVEHPASGLSIGRFPYAYADAMAGTDSRPFKTPNNMLLQVWADAGVLGLLALGWIVLRSCRLLKALFSRKCRPPEWHIAGSIAASLGLAIHGVFEANTVIVWASADSYVTLASPLPYTLLGLSGFLDPSKNSEKRV